jgi:hypothetical protein
MGLKPATRGHFVNYVSNTKITKYFRQLGIQIIVILLHAAREKDNKKQA